MGFVRAILMLVGMAAIVAVGWVVWTFRDFDPKAAGVYYEMFTKLAETGNAVEATVWREKVDEGYTFEEIDESIQSVALEQNIKDVGALPLGAQVEAMLGKEWRKLKLYLYCNPLTAAKMVDASPAYAAWLPCRIALVEDDAGELWIYSLNMDMMIHGGLPLEPELLEEALHVKEVIQTIMREAAEGAF